MPRTATATKTPAKKATTAKPSSSVKKSAVSAKTTELPAKTTRARAKKVVEETPVAPVKTPRTKKAVGERVIATDNPNLLNADVDGKKKIGGYTYTALAEILGFGVGTEQFLAALELMKGGETRAEVNDRVKGLLPATTQTGTPKQVTNLVSGVHNRMLARGFKIQGSYKLVLVKGASAK